MGLARRAAVAAAAICVGVQPSVAAFITSPNRTALATASMVPRLEPMSHEVFYTHDYPKDLQPEPYHKFDHPFPILQDDEDYDKDFVKDENSDNGEWAVQEHYDRLRGRLAHAREVAEKKHENEALQASRVRELERKELLAKAAADQALRDKLAAEERASKKLVEAEAAYDDAKKNEVGDYGIPKQSEEVNKRNQTLEDCKKELDMARHKLKELQEERARAEANVTALRKIEDDADDHAIDEEKKEASYEEALDAANAKYKVAHNKYEHDLEEYKKAEADLQKAEGTLRKFRNQAVDKENGLYTRSSAAPLAAPLVVAVALLAALQAVPA